MRNSPAYTLIEILVGITIIGLIFGFGFVSFREFSRRQALTGAAKQIVGDLRLAQGEAVAGKKPDNINCNTPNTLNGYNFRVDSSTTYAIEANCSGNGGTNIEVKSVTVSNDITIAVPSPNPVIFKALGQGTNITQAGTATVTLTQAGTGSQTTVTISASGEIK
jgi:prepilin-type N-terminal cleavage/methylation domain-containing protein